MSSARTECTWDDRYSARITKDTEVNTYLFVHSILMPEGIDDRIYEIFVICAVVVLPQVTHG